MASIFSRRALAPVALTLLLALFALTFTACNGSDEDAGAGTASAAASASTSDLQVLFAVQELGRAGLHDIDDAINKDKKVPATARTTSLKMATLVELTEWPSELQNGATQVQTALKDLAKAIESNDMTAAGAAAKKAHDVEHDFSGVAWKYLYGKAGINTSATSTGH